MTIIVIPNNFSFRHRDIYDFNPAISIFDWDLKNTKVLIDFSSCFSANYQALALVTLYVWHLKINNCSIEFKLSENREGASKMWRLMGAVGWSQVLKDERETFNGNSFKPLIAIRNQQDFSKAISTATEYTKDFNVEYEHTLRHVISELLYNTLEHGKSFFEVNKHQCRLPSIMQFTWYQNHNELHFIIADIGMGIKRHLEQTYPAFQNDSIAILESIKPHVSGTFGLKDPYKNKDNAGVGLYISSNLIRRLNADMYVVSGNGVVHVSPSDITANELANKWPGTFVLVSVKLGRVREFDFHRLMSEFREAAKKELDRQQQKDDDDVFTINIQNFFGRYAENKEAAISYRDKYLLPAISENKSIILDFFQVESAPHSFLSALLATPVKRLGIIAYKKIKIANADVSIRETIDYIFDENTSNPD